MFDFTKQEADVQTLKSTLENVLIRFIYQMDNEIKQVHYEFLANNLLKLLKIHNRSENINGDEWQFLNMRKEFWNYGTANLIE